MQPIKNIETKEEQIHDRVLKFLNVHSASDIEVKSGFSKLPVNENRTFLDDMRKVKTAKYSTSNNYSSKSGYESFRPSELFIMKYNIMR